MDQLVHKKSNPGGSLNITEKLRLVFLPAFWALMLVTVLHPLLVWIVFFQLHIVEYNLWLSLLVLMLLLVLLYYMVLRARFSMILVNKQASTLSEHPRLLPLCILMFPFPAVAITQYLSTATYDLVEISSPFDINVLDGQKYYKVLNYSVDTSQVYTASDWYISGKNSNSINFYYSVVLPFRSGSITEGTARNVWFGLYFYESHSHEAKANLNHERYTLFLEDAQRDWPHLTRQKATYFELIIPKDGSAYHEALSKTGSPNYIAAIVLEPKFTAFEERGSEEFRWIFRIFGLSTIILLLFSVLPGYRTIYRK